MVTWFVHTGSAQAGSELEADLSCQQPISTFQSQGAYSTGDTAQGTIQNGIAAEVPNGL